MILVTATPMLNAPHDVWALLSIADPHRHGSFWRFAHRYFRVTTDWAGRKRVGELADPEGFRSEVSRYVLVRRRSGLRGEGEARSVLRRRVDHRLSGEQADLYRDEARAAPRRHEERLSWLTRLRQLAVHPALVHEGYRGTSKVDSLRAVLGERDTPTLVFCRQASLVEILREEVGADALHGGMSRSSQADALRRLRDGSSRTLALTHGTGGEGLNLEAADRAVWMDLAWHPGGNLHALGRINRPGQASDRVEAIVIHSSDTIEDDILDIVRRKEPVTTGELLRRLMGEGGRDDRADNYSQEGLLERGRRLQAAPRCGSLAQRGEGGARAGGGPAGRPCG